MNYLNSMQAQIALCDRAVALDDYYQAPVGSRARREADLAIIEAEAQYVRLAVSEPNCADLLRVIGR